MQEEIWDGVYSVYSPKRYRRRYDFGGLGDRRNIRTELVQDGFLEVSNETPLNDEYGFGSGNKGKSLTEIIVSGKGYDYHNGGAYEQPRPFIDDTIDSLQKSKRLEKAFKKGLRNRGIDVK